MATATKANDGGALLVDDDLVRRLEHVPLLARPHVVAALFAALVAT
eukprot:CAMPEP_0198313432 /NCGR_PEP_ID=MMETSP1450-20131203/4449_1 /TAXON_ID=753684 ORGANISM="Madagascaria erythrocladiodes, Strain CCMP3234" /NCGR_SAMPLE_ID=MMETSP1450 /ASSEMBLY_ACC=CAM_ASM_001115 /LENGTH=45 /DNA_ID= /DNA_START= /DNA_END= /DNA_ORIENTATION=